MFPGTRAGTLSLFRLGSDLVVTTSLVRWLVGVVASLTLLAWLDLLAALALLTSLSFNILLIRLL